MSGFPIDFESEEFDNICKKDFADYDKNESGHIERGELRKWLDDLRNEMEKICPGQGVEKIQVTDENVNDILSGLDIDGDERLNFEEFKELAKMVYSTLFSAMAQA